MTSKFLVLLLFMFPATVMAQTKRLQPGKVYEPGEALFAPRYGFKASVPANWTGSLPRESEVFLLSSMTSPAEIFVLGRESDLPTMKKSWESGFDMDGEIKLKAKEATITNGVLSSEVIAVGAFINKSMRTYAVARCGDSGACVTCLAVMPAQQYSETKQTADAFLAAATLEVPSSSSPYDDFNWNDFLSNQMLTTYAFLENGSKETSVHLCANGTFSAKVTKKGILKNQNPAYKGNLKGTWKVDGIGPKGMLHLVFGNKLPGMDIELTITDEKIFGGGERYFVGISDKCK